MGCHDMGLCFHNPFRKGKSVGFIWLAFTLRFDGLNIPAYGCCKGCNPQAKYGCENP